LQTFLKAHKKREDI